jgi:hypothetical protein
MNYGPVISRSHIEERPIGARPIRSIIYGRRLRSAACHTPKGIVTGNGLAARETSARAQKRAGERTEE